MCAWRGRVGSAGGYVGVGLDPARLVRESKLARLDFGCGKNEAIFGWMRLRWNGFDWLTEGGGRLRLALLALATVGLDDAELIESFVELAGETLGVEAKSGEGASGIGDAEGQWSRRQ